MPVSTLIIRNVALMSDEELSPLLKLMSGRKASCASPTFFSQAPQDSFDREALNEFRENLKTTKFREILYEIISEEYEAHVILHFDEDFSLERSAEEQPTEKDYILSKIEALEARMQVNVFYMGGAHGGFSGLSSNEKLSGLGVGSVREITDALKAKNMSMHSGILQSCYSALFISHFRGLLIDENAPLVSYSAEVGGGSAWEMITDWILSDQRHPFFSDDALTKACIQDFEGATTSVLSTQYFSQLMDLNNEAVNLPDYIEKNDETEFQRELVRELLEEEAKHTRSILTHLKTDSGSFNEVSVMTDFNEWLKLSLEAKPSSELGAASSSSP